MSELTTSVGEASLTVTWAGFSWDWTLRKPDGEVVQTGDGLMAMTVKQTPESATKSLILFLLAATDQPLAVFNDSAVVWALTYRDDLRAALKVL